MSNSGRDRDEEELAALLADLERTLTELRSEIGADVRRGDRSRRPPTPGEILRFTEEYTIPTLISLLEATVRSLELLRAVLRLAGPRSVDDRRRGVPDAPETDALRNALTDLREALTRPDLPRDSTAGSILADARDLTEEIDDRLSAERGDDAPAAGDESRSGERGGVAIDVSEEEQRPDVDAELASIKESMNAGTDASGTDEKNGTDETSGTDDAVDD
jgi:hypothetical protein